MDVPMRRIRMEDLAEECGVSVATVSRVLTDKPGVRADIRERVRKAAAAMGYSAFVPSAGQKVALVASRAAMVDMSRSQFTLHVVEGLRERAAQLGMVLETLTATGGMAEAVAGSDADGFLLLTPQGDEEVAEVAALNRQVVLVNGEDPTMRLSSVAPCNRAAAAQATAHLLRLGHKRILFMTRSGRKTIAERHAGWAEEMARAGLPVTPDLVVEVEDWIPDLAARTIKARLAQGPRDFTAILCAGDSLAYGALIGLAEAGVSVPHEVSVLGFDGLPQCDFQMPPLSAVTIPMRHLGAVALDLLRDQLAGGGMPPRRIELACPVVERASTAPV